MATLQEQFELATFEAKNLKKRPDNDTLLRMYGLAHVRPLQTGLGRRCQRTGAGHVRFRGLGEVPGLAEA